MPFSLLNLAATHCCFRELSEFSSLPFFPNSPTKGRHSARNWYHWYHRFEWQWGDSRRVHGRGRMMPSSDRMREPDSTSGTLCDLTEDKDKFTLARSGFKLVGRACHPAQAGFDVAQTITLSWANAIARYWFQQEKLRGLLSPLQRATQRRNLRSGGKIINCAKMIRPSFTRRCRCWKWIMGMLHRHTRSGWASLLMSSGDGNVLIKRSFLHDDVQVLLMHNQVKIREWIAINQKQIGNVACLDLTEFVAHSHYLPPDAGAALQRLAG